MIVTDVDIPPELEAAVSDILSLDPTGADGTARARTRRAARESRTRQRQRASLLALKSAAEEIARRLELTPGSSAWKNTVYENLRELLQGIFNPKYWLDCVQIAEHFLSTSPTYGPDPSPKPYSYRTEDNLPTLATYAAGSISAGPASYTGLLEAGYFHDSSLTWSRHVFQLLEPFSAGEPTPLIARLAGTLAVDADTRGSRPMLSVLIKTLLAPSGHSIETTNQSVTDAADSFYWRYHPPAAAAPYYHASQDVRIIHPVNGPKHFVTAGDAERATILAAPRPMFGYGQNNNETVETELIATPELWQLSPCINRAGAPIAYATPASIRLIDTTTGESTGASLPAATTHRAYRGSRHCVLSTAKTFYLLDQNFSTLRSWTIPTVTAQGISWLGPHPLGFFAVLWRYPDPAHSMKWIISTQGQVLSETTVNANYGPGQMIPDTAGWNRDQVGAGEHASQNLWFSHPDGGLMGWTQFINAISYIWPHRDGVFTLSSDDLIRFTPWPAYRPASPDPGVIAEAITIGESPHLNTRGAAVRDGLYIWDGINPSQLIATDGTVTELPFTDSATASENHSACYDPAL